MGQCLHLHVSILVFMECARRVDCSFQQKNNLDEFQSLFLWNVLVEGEPGRLVQRELPFQSLFLWNVLVEPVYINSSGCRSMFQSLFLWNVLVEKEALQAFHNIVEFQSLFLWNVLVESHGGGTGLWGA